MGHFISPAPPRWRRFDTLAHRVGDWVLIALGLLISISVCWITIESRFSFFVWSIALCFYFLFYRRILQVLYWSWSTFRLLRCSNTTREKAPSLGHSREQDKSPLFHILVASYKASESIGPVIKAMANQTYPLDRYHAWIITDQKEQIEINDQVENLMRRALSYDPGQPKDAKMLPFLWRCLVLDTTRLDAWIEQVTTGNLKGYLNTPEIAPTLIEDLLSILLQDPNRKAILQNENMAPLCLRKTEINRIGKELDLIEAEIKRIIDDFSRLLGSEKIYLREDLKSQFVTRSARKRALRKIGRNVCKRFSDPRLSILIPSKDQIERTAKKMILSTQEKIEQTTSSLPVRNIHHLNPHRRGFKPGALNAAYYHIKKLGLLENPENTYFIIIDSDSLLPSRALDVIASEVCIAGQDTSILQMASIPTANFFSGGWFSKFLAYADAIGAVGKWARSTRRQLKPDLHAGSGVVVPATLSSFIEENTGKPWDESTLTEDARLIVGQFGMMNGVGNTTKMAPIYLLEAVPSGESFWETYRSFWNQRRRWTTGGYDEFFYILSSPAWLRHTRYDRYSKQWRVYAPGSGNRVRFRAKQYYRLALWFWDHFIWGVGGFIAFTHWWLISTVVAAPSAFVSWVGLSAVLMAPLLFLLASAQQLSFFTPGGLSGWRKCVLYPQSFFAIWFYCLPVVATQLACVFGFRAAFIEWKPTQKPRYQPANILGSDE